MDVNTHEMTYTAQQCEDITQEFKPYEFPGVMVETDLNADKPLPPPEPLKRSLWKRIIDGLYCARAAFLFEIRDEWEAPY